MAMPSRYISWRAVAAALTAAVALAAPQAAFATEIDGQGYGSRYGGAYGDPRYADDERYPSPRPDSSAGPGSPRLADRYGGRDDDGDERYAGTAPSDEQYFDGPDVDENVDDDDSRDSRQRYGEDERQPYRRDGYTDDGRGAPHRSFKDQPAEVEPLPGPRRYSEPYREPPRIRGCAPRRLVRHSLHEDGWFDLHGIRVAGPQVFMLARRESGRLFELRLDRCTGRVLHAEVISRPDRGVWVRGPRRWYPTY